MLNAGDWSLYPVNQLSYYGRQPLAKDTIKNTYMLRCDSAFVSAAGTAYYYGCKSGDEELDKCLPVIYWQYKYIQRNHLQIDSIIETDSESLIFYYEQKLPIVFKHKAIAGESRQQVFQNFQIIDTITITCVNEYKLSILGREDDVKSFRISGSKDFGNKPALDSMEIILSRNFGFITFINFSQLINRGNNTYFSEYMLDGLATASDTLGYRQPEFDDYFIWKAGDMRKWEESNGWGGPHQWFTRYYRDSITTVTKNADELIIRYDREVTGTDTTYHILYNQEEKYDLRQMRQIFRASSFFAGLDRFDLLFENFDENFPIINSTYLEKNLNNNLIYKKFDFNGSLIEADSCQLGLILDCNEGVVFTPLLGLSMKTHYGWGYWVERLIAVRNDSLSFGDLTTLGVDDEGDSDIKIYPNPARDYIRIETTGIEPIRYEIIDLLSEPVLEGMADNNAIDVSSLPSGVYYLRAGNIAKKIVIIK